MNAIILCVGKLKENYFKDAVNEYSKRLSRYGSFQIIEVPDQPEPSKPSIALEKQIIVREGQDILAKIKPQDHVIALCVSGNAPTSEGLAQLIGTWSMNGKRIVFVIGGSLGLSDDVINRADEKLSCSNLTFPHQLMRVILLEQLYRGLKINSNERYHK